MRSTTTSNYRALEPSPLPDISESLQTAFIHNSSGNAQRGRPGTRARHTDSTQVSPSPSSTSSSPSTPSSPNSNYPAFRSGDHHHHRDRSRSPLSVISSPSSSIINGSSRGRPTSPFPYPFLLLRHRPSAVDLALSEERSRCDEDAIERIGLSLLEPRPVDPIPRAMDSLNANLLSELCRNDISPRSSVSSASSSITLRQPRYVMGGIFEVMEGNA
ncbi:hypothetical protein VTN31DRAFT_6206 [Thermomyces dupontii]|uniref:uncharacterized protein n=1 Tax=Talaromyces thermophilus TaxID=28565 RepID=UPI0037435FB9